ncbi:AEC family transporter [Palleronia sp.]|uniref:AEC family transporter n=1 Tax=Palleronia sp. TaxID=1940284 RepID=UPI0035C7EB01
MLFVTIWPVFALICLGFVLRRAGFPEPGFWPAAERANYVLLFPALLVSTLATAPVRDPDILRLGGAVVVMIGIAALLMLLFRRVRPMPARRFGPALQGVVRFNTYLGLAIVASLSGEAGLERAAVLLAVAVPLVNVLSVMALTDGAAAGGIRGLVQPVLRNPLILACLIGIAIALVGSGLPHGTGRFLELIAQASLPLGLLCVGAALRPAAMRRDMLPLFANTLVRLFAMPALAVLVAGAVGLGGVETLVLVVFAAIPSAPTAYVLTQQLRGDGELMAGIVTAQTVGSVLTIPVVLSLAGLG